MTLRNLLQLRNFTPRVVWRLLWEGWWNVFWAIERGRTLVQTFKLPEYLRGSERAILLESLSLYSPLQTVLEFGMGYGQSYQLVRRAFPKVHYVGVDLNPACVQGCEKLLKDDESKLTEFIHADAYSMAELEDGAFDIVITSASLIYISADEIESVVKELYRLSKKALLLMELHLANPAHPSFSEGVQLNRGGRRGVYWVRDYHSLLTKFVAPEQISLFPVPKALWKAEDWSSMGTLITVDKQGLNGGVID